MMEIVSHVKSNRSLRGRTRVTRLRSGGYPHAPEGPASSGVERGGR